MHAISSAYGGRELQGRRLHEATDGPTSGHQLVRGLSGRDSTPARTRGVASRLRRSTWHDRGGAPYGRVPEPDRSEWVRQYERDSTMARPATATVDVGEIDERGDSVSLPRRPLRQ